MTTSKRLEDIEKQINAKIGEGLPVIEANMWDFIRFNAPKLGRRTHSFRLMPMWEQPVLDNHPNQVFVNGRQTRKTTHAAVKAAHRATSKAGVEIGIVLDNDVRLNAFSRQRLRRDVIKSNPDLDAYLPYGRAAITTINFLNDSVIYLRTDENEYANVEGLSLDLLVTDETQYHDYQFIHHALHSQTYTHGDFMTLGIGGEAGSPWHDRWLSSDQNEWHYDNDSDYVDPSTGRVWVNQGWRNELIFDNDGEIVNDDLDTVLKGRWVPQNPTATEVRGYHMPQIIFPHIPLTIYDAIHKYKIPSWFSIEWIEKNQPRTIVMAHSKGEFYKAERRPITPEMVRACMIPYQWLTLLGYDQVNQFKKSYGNQCRILGGIDFGSSTVTPTTVLSILIHWRLSGRYQLAHIEKIPQDRHPYDKARHIADTFRKYGVDIAVGDWGHGQDMIPMIQTGGRDSNDNPFEGLGRNTFYGCQTLADETKPIVEFQRETNEKGHTQLGKFKIDKTTAIQEFIDFIGWKVPIRDIRQPWLEPKGTDTNAVPKFMIPFKNDYETDWLIKEFTRITRKDLAEDPDEQIEDPRQKVQKQFNHPPDAVMSIIYCLVADKHYQEDTYHIHRTKKVR